MNKKNKIVFLKPFKPKVKVQDKDYKNLILLYGICGLRIDESCLLTESQLESFRRTLKKVVKKIGTIWLRTKAYRTITKKPGEVRMGKGKGSPSHKVSKLKRGFVLVELSGLSYQECVNALKIASVKLPCKTSIIKYKI